MRCNALRCAKRMLAVVPWQLKLEPPRITPTSVDSVTAALMDTGVVDSQLIYLQNRLIKALHVLEAAHYAQSESQQRRAPSLLHAVERLLSTRYARSVPVARIHLWSVAVVRSRLCIYYDTATVTDSVGVQAALAAIVDPLTGDLKRRYGAQQPWKRIAFRRLDALPIYAHLLRRHGEVARRGFAVEGSHSPPNDSDPSSSPPSSADPSSSAASDGATDGTDDTHSDSGSDSSTGPLAAFASSGDDLQLDAVARVRAHVQTIWSNAIRRSSSNAVTSTAVLADISSPTLGGDMRDAAAAADILESTPPYVILDPLPDGDGDDGGGDGGVGGGRAGGLLDVNPLRDDLLGRGAAGRSAFAQRGHSVSPALTSGVSHDGFPRGGSGDAEPYSVRPLDDPLGHEAAASDLEEAARLAAAPEWSALFYGVAREEGERDEVCAVEGANVGDADGGEGGEGVDEGVDVADGIGVDGHSGGRGGDPVREGDQEFDIAAGVGEGMTHSSVEDLPGLGMDAVSVDGRVEVLNGGTDHPTTSSGSRGGRKGGYGEEVREFYSFDRASGASPLRPFAPSTAFARIDDATVAALAAMTQCDSYSVQSSASRDGRGALGGGDGGSARDAGDGSSDENSSNVFSLSLGRAYGGRGAPTTGAPHRHRVSAASVEGAGGDLSVGVPLSFRMRGPRPTLSPKDAQLIRRGTLTAADMEISHSDLLGDMSLMQRRLGPFQKATRRPRPSFFAGDGVGDDKPRGHYHEPM